MLLFVASAFCFGIAVFTISLQITKDLTNVLDSINKNAKIQQNRLRTLKYISEFVGFYSKHKQLSMMTERQIFGRNNNVINALQSNPRFFGIVSANPNDVDHMEPGMH